MMEAKDIQKVLVRIDLVKVTLDNLYQKATEHKNNLKERELLSEAINAVEICQGILNVQKQLINIQLDAINDKL